MGRDWISEGAPVLRLPRALSVPLASAAAAATTLATLVLATLAFVLAALAVALMVCLLFFSVAQGISEFAPLLRGSRGSFLGRSVEEDAEPFITIPSG